MIRKEIFLGFFVGIFSNILGMLFYILVFSDLNVAETLIEAYQGNFLGTLIAAGAILNFLPFFYFLNKKKAYRARGVLMATLLAALSIAFIKIL